MGKHFLTIVLVLIYTASVCIVMAIVGGAILPKLMGHIADKYGMARGFPVPLFCLAAAALYGFCWARLSNADEMHGFPTSQGHVVDSRP